MEELSKAENEYTIDIEVKITKCKNSVGQKGKCQSDMQQVIFREFFDSVN